LIKTKGEYLANMLKFFFIFKKDLWHKTGNNEKLWIY